jgi:hypothetical protein
MGAYTVLIAVIVNVDDIYNMIEILKSEYLEEDTAVYNTSVSFFGIPIFNRIETTTNSQVVSQLKVFKHKRVKGFKHEIEN